MEQQSGHFARRGIRWALDRVPHREDGAFSRSAPTDGPENSTFAGSDGGHGAAAAHSLIETDRARRARMTASPDLKASRFAIAV
jgi:hypothetical protein